MQTIIEDVRARKVLDSRGSFTIEVDVTTRGGSGRASAPSGSSVGLHEVASYPKGGIDQAVRVANHVIAPKLTGMNADEQEKIDLLLHEIDGTKNFQRVGGNTALVVSLAVAKAAASSHGLPLFQQLSGTVTNELPHPLGNVLGGGKHAGKNAPDIQEFLALPVKVASFAEAANTNVHVYAEVRRLLEKADVTFTGGRGDEGAWAPNLKSVAAIEILVGACKAVSDELGVVVEAGLDMAASSLWNEKKKSYVYDRDGVERDRGEQIDYVLNLIKTYRLSFVEDPLNEEDFKGFSEITRRVKDCLICGDDLFVTNKERLEIGIKRNAGNAIIIKPNQIGTLTDAYETVKLAKKAGYVPVASHRSGETCDPYLAHVAVAFRCPIIKTGVVGGERLAKINELIRIEESFGDRFRVAELTI